MTWCSLVCCSSNSVCIFPGVQVKNSSSHIDMLDSQFFLMWIFRSVACVLITLINFKINDYIYIYLITLIFMRLELINFLKNFKT
jgi:hypothetical protein